MCLVDDGEDLDPVFFDVIEHPHFSDTEPVLGAGEAPKALDSALTQFHWLETKMPLDRVPDLPSDMRPQRSELVCRSRRQNDIVTHFWPEDSQITVPSKGRPRYDGL